MPSIDRTRRRLDPRQERAHASVDAIVHAAELLLEKKGFSSLTTNHIADRAGVNISLVYRYFAGKEAIVGTLIERVAERTEKAIAKVLSDHWGAPLRQFARAIVEVLVDTPGISAAAHRQLVEQVEATKRQQIVQAASNQMREALATWLEEQGQPASAATLFVLQHALQSASHAVAFGLPESIPREEAMASLTDLIAAALA